MLQKSIICQFLENTAFDVNEKFEMLLSGGHIIETIIENLTYNMLNASEDNIWTLLYFTGYLTKMRAAELDKELPSGCYALRIPNVEIMELFRKSVKAWIDKTVGRLLLRRKLQIQKAGSNGNVKMHSGRLKKNSMQCRWSVRDTVKSYVWGLHFTKRNAL